MFNVYTISYYSPYVALELDVGDYSHSVFCYNGYCFSDFQFSDITAVMHAMPSIIIIGVPDFDLWFGRKLKSKNWPEIRTLHSYTGKPALVDGTVPEESTRRPLDI